MNNSPSRQGDGYMYCIDTGSENDHILCDTRELDDIYAEAAAQDGVLRFLGISVDGTIGGKPAKILVGCGRVHPETGLVVRYHDAYTGPDGSPGDVDRGEDEPPRERDRGGGGPSSGFPRLGRSK